MSRQRSSSSATTIQGPIVVAGDGPGIDPAGAERVFERFYRADPSRSRDQGGSGLGLAIAAAIAQGHGGRLELETRPGAGSVFRCVLPVAPRAVDRDIEGDIDRNTDGDERAGPRPPRPTPRPTGG
ncbi:ATP-binding protein [Streptomyces sp. NPDC002265]|uniref:ATP-binding protein n=1 Tax=Streptomyces sp. NPDC002265 TaxID=3154415 RepID=UPI00332AC44B